MNGVCCPKHSNSETKDPDLSTVTMVKVEDQNVRLTIPYCYGSVSKESIVINFTGHLTIVKIMKVKCLSWTSVR